MVPNIEAYVMMKYFDKQLSVPTFDLGPCILSGYVVPVGRLKQKNLKSKNFEQICYTESRLEKTLEFSLRFVY